MTEIEVKNNENVWSFFDSPDSEAPERVRTTDSRVHALLTNGKRVLVGCFCGHRYWTSCSPTANVGNKHTNVCVWLRELVPEGPFVIFAEEVGNGHRVDVVADPECLKPLFKSYLDIEEMIKKPDLVFIPHIDVVVRRRHVPLGDLL